MANKYTEETSAVLKKVFSDAPDDLSVPTSARELFKPQLLTPFNEKKTLTYSILAALGVISLLMLVVDGGPGFGGVLFVLVFAVIGWVAWAWSQASKAYFKAYAKARGFKYKEKSPLPNVEQPFFQRGDKRKCSHVLSGKIGGVDVKYGHYTYVEKGRDSDDKDDTYNYTFLYTKLPKAVAERYVGVSLSPRGVSFGKLQDIFTGSRKVEMESTAFNKRYSLRVDSKQQDVALYELFNTIFVDDLANDLHLHWEQLGKHLVMYKKGHLRNTQKLDDMCIKGTRVITRYHEEYQ